MSMAWNKIKNTFELVKFSHSIFALPFALASLFFASGGLPSLKIIVLIIAAMVTARNTAMAFNRLVDAPLDAKNPRTAVRHLPQGLLSRRFVILFIIINAIFFIWISSLLNPLTFKLAPLALFVICFYSYTKYFTHLAQLFLGLSLAIAPVGAWISVTGSLTLFPILMGMGVLFWVAGFDIYYATQDYEFDKKEGLKSLVVRLGIQRAFLLARFFHLLSIVFFLAAGFWNHLGVYYLSTVILIGIFLIIEHFLVKPHDLSRINAAFFNMNGMIGVIYLVGSIIDVLA